MRRGFIAVIVAMVLLMPGALMAAPSVYPTGTTIYKPEKAWSGFTILAGKDGRLVDMNGNLVKTWPGVFGFPNKVLPGGYLLTMAGRWKYGYQDMMNVQIRDFNNNVVWDFNKWHEGTANKGKDKIWLARAHHDIQLKGNPVGYYIPGYDAINTKKGTVMVLAHYNTKNDKINAKMPLLSDVIYEVDMATGEVVWTWKAIDHLEEMGFDAAALKAFQSFYDKQHAKREGDGFDWWHQNCASYLGPNKWYDQGDKRFHPDNIIFDSRETNILAIADHETGKIVWKTGPNYDKGEDAQLRWMIGIHNTHMIPKGLPGAGNILVYDNGGWAGYGKPNGMSKTGGYNVWRDYSRVIEFDPITKKIVWEYSPRTIKTMEIGHHYPGTHLFGYKEYSPFISNAQRLPNGNTLICEGSNGRLIEVTKDLEVVWEYISPYLYSGPITRNIVYRAYRVPYSWVPQLEKPREIGVLPSPNHSFQIPAVDGSKPDIGHAKTKMWEPAMGVQ